MTKIWNFYASWTIFGLSDQKDKWDFDNIWYFNLSREYCKANMIVKFEKFSIIDNTNILPNLSIKDYLVMVLIKWMVFAFAMNLMFDKFMLVWLHGNFQELALNIFHPKYFSFSIFTIHAPTFICGYWPAKAQYSDLFKPLLFIAFLYHTHRHFCLLLFFDVVFFHGVIISRQQMRWKFLMVSLANYLQLFSELFQSFPHWFTGLSLGWEPA